MDFNVISCKNPGITGVKIGIEVLEMAKIHHEDTNYIHVTYHFLFFSLSMNSFAFNIPSLTASSLLL